MGVDIKKKNNVENPKAMNHPQWLETFPKWFLIRCCLTESRNIMTRRNSGVSVLQVFKFWGSLRWSWNQTWDNTYIYIYMNSCLGVVQLVYRLTAVGRLRSSRSTHRRYALLWLHAFLPMLKSLPLWNRTQRLKHSWPVVTPWSYRISQSTSARILQGSICQLSRIQHIGRSDSYFMPKGKNIYIYRFPFFQICSWFTPESEEDYTSSAGVDVIQFPILDHKSSILLSHWGHQIWH